jgi:DNA gyrase/topoisomerase IV subunit A
VGQQLVREMLTRTRADGGVVNADDYRPDGLEKDYGMGSDGLYRLSDTQAQEILQMRLQRLTGLEQDKIVAEYKDVMARSRTCWTSWPARTRLGHHQRRAHRHQARNSARASSARAAA